jgi:homoserine dehydrogenase
MNVITSNKGPLVIDPDLDQAAGKNGVLFKYGATVTTMPVIDLSKYGLAGYDIASFEGIFTGVTNYILTEIEKGNSFEKALEVASKAGLVEKDPSIDLDGWDSACKVVILANSIMKKRATIKDISVRGIRDVDRNDILEAKRKNCTIKLIGEAARTNHSLDLKVQAKLIPQEHFFAKAKGLGKAISYKTDMEGEIILYSERYNLTSTAARIITDLLNLSNEIT